MTLITVFVVLDWHSQWRRLDGANGLRRHYRSGDDLIVGASLNGALGEQGDWVDLGGQHGWLVELVRQLS